MGVKKGVKYLIRGDICLTAQNVYTELKAIIINQEYAISQLSNEHASQSTGNKLHSNSLEFILLIFFIILR